MCLSAIALLCRPDTALAQTATITASSTSLAFTSAAGQPQPQSVTISAVGSSVNYSTSTNQSWLSVFPATGVATTGGSLVQVAISTPNLAVGTYSGIVTVTPTTGPAVAINVSYTVVGAGGGSGTFTLNPNPVVFNIPAGGPAATQSVTLSTTAASATVTLQTSVTTGINWLQVSTNTAAPSPSTPATFTVTATPGLLPAGSYTGFLNVFQAGSATAVLAVPVTLTVGTSTGGAGPLSASPSQLSFTVTPGSLVPVTQSVSLSTMSAAIVTGTASVNTSPGSGWLSVLPASFSTSSALPVSIVVSVNPSTLTSGVGYTGNVVVSTSDGGTVTIPISVNGGTVGGGGTSVLSATPNPLSISVPSGSNTPTNQSLTITIASGSGTFTAQAQGLSWLSVNPPTSAINAGFPVVLTVSANPTGQSAGSYNGSIVVTPAGGGTALTIPVTVTIGSQPTVTITPNAQISFAYQIGTAFPTAQTLSITSNGAAVGFSASAATTSGGPWLIVTPQSGTTSSSGGAAASVTIQVNPGGLPAGIYNGTVSISVPGATNSLTTIPVQLTTTQQPILQVNPASVTFNYQFGSTTQPSQQQIQVTSSGNPIDYRVSAIPGSGGNWLQVTPSTGTTNGALSVSVNPSALAQLAPGTYSASVSLTSAGTGNAAGNSPVTIPVQLVVGNNNLMTVSQNSLTFNFQLSKASPSVQTFTVGSIGTPINYTVAVTGQTCGGNFLSVTPASGTTTGTVAAAINVLGLVTGTCTANIVITSTSAGVGNSPVTVPVTLNVSNTPLLNYSPAAINVTTQVNTNPANQTISLTSTDSGVSIPFTVTYTPSNGGNIVLVGPTSGSTPSNLTVGFQTIGLPPATYTGTLNVTPSTSGVNPAVVPVNVFVSSSITGAVAPISLTFTQPFAGVAPPAQTLAITSSNPGLTYSVSASTLNGSNWLTVIPAGGTTPGNATVSVNGAGLGQGTYSGVVTVLMPGASNPAINVPVTLTITPPQNLSVTPTQLNFAYQQTTLTGPAAQAIQITSTAGTLPFTITTSSTPANLIVATPTTGNTAASVQVSLNQSVLSTLAVGSYSGTVTVASTGGGTQTVGISVSVTAPPPPNFVSVVNSATNQAGAVSPGEIVTIYGTNIGPTPGVGLTLTPSNTVATILANTAVTFDGIQAPLIYVSAGQINCIVPYEIAGRVNTSVQVQRNGLSSNSVIYNVASAAPGIFSANQSGNGQGAILNANNTYNGPTNPVARNSYIQIYATGEGALVPNVSTGSVTSATGPTFPKPQGAVTLTIGGLPAQILYAGEAPGLVSGVLQVNAVIPTGLPANPNGGVVNAPIVLTVGSVTNTQQTITVAVQ